MDDRSITSQAVGAYGEKVVEAELLRHGWIPANVNATVKNAADYDMVVQKQGRVALLRVKTCGPRQRGFQFYIDPGKRFSGRGIPANDFTVLVSMGETRDGDEFWVAPTKDVRERLRAHQKESSPFHALQRSAIGSPSPDGTRAGLSGQGHHRQIRHA